MVCSGVSRQPRKTRTVPSTSAPIQKKAQERAAGTSKLFMHALLALCCMMNTGPPTGHLVNVLKCLIKLRFTLGPIRLGPKTRFFWALKAALAEKIAPDPQIF